MKLFVGLILAIFISLVGCVKIDPGSIRELEKAIGALAKNSTTVCGQIAIGGGVGALALTSMPTIPLGGGGYSNLIICRTNQRGTIIVADSSGVTIKHGIYNLDDLLELEEPESIDELEEDL